MRPKRDVARWYRPIISPPQIGAHLDLSEKNLVTVRVGDTSLDAVVDVHAGGSDTAFVSFSAALSVSEWTVPYFVGTTLAGDLPVHRVMLSDPGLDTPGTPRLAWYAGTQQVSGSLIAEFLTWIVESLHVSRVVLFGASGGGFAALNYARYFPGSSVVAVNPQTNLLRYYPESWMKYAESAFGAKTPNAAAEVIRERTVYDLCAVYSNCADTSVLYVQNETDAFHIVEHMHPFLGLCSSDVEVRVLMGDWGTGHVAPPREELQEIVQATLQKTVDGPDHP